MASGQLRREADIERVRALAAGSGGRVGIVALPGAGQPRFVLDLDYATAGSPRYPDERQPRSRVAIELSARHPFLPPTATVLTPIHHPNVFPSGVVCLGAKWLASEGMDLFVARIARLLAFDPLLVNEQSVAHSAALLWYRAARWRHPQAFPTDAAALALGVPPDERAAAPAPDRVLRTCPGCGTALRLLAGRSGSVTCPRCAVEFEVQT
jgi:hypothetical protein